jgi:UDPglucose 6-dehydrogenase/GDP-mannose 6-dehydrogenase
MKVCVVGTGYVGLVTGACLADRGHEVVCVDRDDAKVAAIAARQSPIHEQGLDEVLARVAGTTLRATTDLRAAVRASEISLLCVGTPFDGQTIDLSMIEHASREVGAALAGTAAWHTVVVRSTVVPGTTDGLVRAALEDASGRAAGREFGLGMNPEFLTEGTAIQDFQEQDRIVIGASDERSRAAIEGLYAGFPEVPRIRVNPRTAEMIKYASNALLATAISFANELADVCSALGGIDVVDVMRGVHLSRYLTPREPQPAGSTAPLALFLEAGCGYGGSCLPKDVKAIVAHGRRAGVPMRLLQAVDDVNGDRAASVLALLNAHFPSLRGVAVSVLGWSFKPGTDDTRETPARPIVQALLDAGAQVTVHDPISAGQVPRVFGEDRVTVAPSLESAVRSADTVVLVTRWPEYQAVHELAALCDPPPLVVDGRRVLDPSRFARYAGIGRGNRDAL